MHERQSQTIAFIVGPYQVPAGSPGDLAGFGIPEDDSRHAGDKDDGDSRRLGWYDARRRPRAAGGEQEDNEEKERQERSVQMGS
jgi:hypothetical protein